MGFYYERVCSAFSKLARRPHVMCRTYMQHFSLLGIPCGNNDHIDFADHGKYWEDEKTSINSGLKCAYLSGYCCP